MRTNPRPRLLTGFIVLLITVGSIYSNAQCPSPCQGLSNPLEFEALQALYCATDGDNWFVNTGWAEGINDGTNCDYCTWYGIKCNEDQQVIAIDLDGMVDFDFNALDGNNLNGHLPIEVANLSLLSELYLSENKLKDTIPLQIIANKWFDYLDLSYNEITSLDLGSNVSPWTYECERANLSNNQITAELRTIDCSGLGIEYLNLSHNQFTGLMPPLRGFWVDLSHNNLTGTIDSIADYSNIERLDLSYNNFDGHVPANITSIPYLTKLDLSFNRLVGCIPQPLIALCNTQVLKLNGNKAMPWEGTSAAFCATNGFEFEQIGQPCDDGNDENGTEDKIDQNCNCVPQIVNNQSIEVDITIGPNPTDGKINITSNQNTNLSYVIHDLDGITRSRGDLDADLIDIGHLPTGLYILTIIDESGQRVLTKKIIRV